MPGRVILGVDFGDLKYFPPFKRGVFYCWYCMMHKWWALMTAAHSHLSSLCKLPSARNGLCPNKKQRSSAWISTARLGRALAELERLSGHRCSFFFLWLAFRQNWCTLAGQFACLASAAVLPNEHSAVKNKADDLNCFKHCHWPWWPLYRVHCTSVLYLGETLDDLVIAFPTVQL